LPFNEFSLSEDILKTLAANGYEKPTPIQQKALPHGLDGKDVMGQAETGTGKTLAFMLPILETVDAQRVSVQGLVVTPTRELAQQIKVEFDKFAPAKKLKVSLLIGGEPIGNQIVQLRMGCQIAVGTPGRLIDHLQSRTLTLGWVEHLVLDEADEMLDMGFIDAIRQILKHCPKERQTALYSATFPKELQRLAKSCMSDPIQVSTIQGLQTVEQIDQQVIFVSSDDKIDKLAEILDGDDRNIYLVFCQTRRETDVVYRRLSARGYPVAALHGDFSQEHRTKVMERFRKGHVQGLIATDVASRGLDIDIITHVINFSVPDDPRRYVHRIGRTGRAGRTGVAITLVSPEDRRYLRALSSIAGAEELSASGGGDDRNDRGSSRRPRGRSTGNNRNKDSLKSRRGSRQKHHRR
jgi:ATP-dependent RNA helicase DeaD